MGMSKSLSSLVMVGTVHRDPKGETKLLHLLEQERPSLITIEVSPYARIFRAHQAAALRATLRKNLQRIRREEGRPLREIIPRSAILGIFLLLKEPYEWRAAKAYADRHGIDLRDIDLSCYSKDKLSHVADLISLENLRTLVRVPSFDLSRQVESHYSRARFLFRHPPSFWPTIKEVKHREAYMAEEIRSLVQQENGKKILHVGGWEHLLEFPQGKSLFGLLEDLRPQRILLASMAN
jgi:hypothetical protein